MAAGDGLTGISTRDGRVTVTVDDEKLKQFGELKAIGKGKFSTVFRAAKVDGSGYVALKRIQIFNMMDEKSREKCLKEIHLVKAVSHRNIIAFHDAFIVNKELWLVFEYAEAGDLKRQLRKARERKARFDERVIWKYFSQVASAVAHMHERHVMHRDLKPANIFLTLNGTVKVGDLGLGRYLSEHTLEAFSKVGTPLYMSPEVLQGKGYDYKSDTWSLGCVLYELAMLISPFKEEGLNLYGLFQKISKGTYPPVSTVYSSELGDLVHRMLAADPADRPDMAEVTRVSEAMLERCEEQRRAASQGTPTQGPSAPDPEAAAAAEVAASEGKQAPPSPAPSPVPAPTPAPAPAPAGPSTGAVASGGGDAGGLGPGRPIAPGVLDASAGPSPLAASLLAAQDPLMLSTTAIAQLQCLGYESAWCPVVDAPPLPPHYFALPDAEGAAASTLQQFHTFASLVSWCVTILQGPKGGVRSGTALGDASRDALPWGPDGKFAPPNVRGDAITRALGEHAGAPHALIDACLPRDVAAGHGLAACRLLSFAASSALAHAGWVWARPAYGGEGDGIETVEGPDPHTEVGGVADDGIADEGGWGAGDEEEEVLYSEGKASEAPSSPARRMLQSGVPPAVWEREVERARTAIVSRLRGLGLGDITAAAASGGGGWRGHFAATHRHFTAMTKGGKGTAPTTALSALDRTGAGAGSAAERIRAAESRINAEHSGADGAVGQYRTLHERAVELRESVAAATAAVDAGVAALGELEEDVEGLSAAVEARGDSVSDASPLQKIRGALARLRKENAGLTVRVGIAVQRMDAAGLRSAEEKRNAARKGLSDELELEDEEV